MGSKQLDVRVWNDILCRYFALARSFDPQYFRLVDRQAQRQALEVENDIRDILNDARDRRELVQHTVDLDIGHGCTWERREQHAPKRIAQGDAEAALERLDHKRRAAVARARALQLRLFEIPELTYLPRGRHSATLLDLWQLVAAQVDESLARIILHD